MFGRLRLTIETRKFIAHGFRFEGANLSDHVLESPRSQAVATKRSKSSKVGNRRRNFGDDIPEGTLNEWIVDPEFRVSRFSFQRGGITRIPQN